MEPVAAEYRQNMRRTEDGQGGKPAREEPKGNLHPIVGLKQQNLAKRKSDDLAQIDVSQCRYEIDLAHLGHVSIVEHLNRFVDLIA